MEPLAVDTYNQACGPAVQTLRDTNGTLGDAHPAVLVEGRVRRVTLTEAERLQGFPDRWTEPAGGPTARYRVLGNSVTVGVGEWVAKRIAGWEQRGGIPGAARGPGADPSPVGGASPYGDRINPS